MVHAERGQVVADQGHHRVDAEPGERLQPFPLVAAQPAVAVAPGDLPGDRDEVVAGVEAFGDGADPLAQRLAVAQVQRAGERLDLHAGVVHVVLARHVVAGIGQHGGERVAEDRAPAVADVQRPGGIVEQYSTLTFRPLPRSLRP